MISRLIQYHKDYLAQYAHVWLFDMTTAERVKDEGLVAIHKQTKMFVDSLVLVHNGLSDVDKSTLFKDLTVVSHQQEVPVSLVNISESRLLVYFPNKVEYTDSYRDKLDKLIKKANESNFELWNIDIATDYVGSFALDRPTDFGDMINEHYFPFEPRDSIKADCHSITIENKGQFREKFYDKVSELALTSSCR